MAKISLTLFTKAFHDRKYPVWQGIDDWNSLGEIDGEDYKAPLASQAIAVEEGPKPLGAETEQPTDDSISNFIIGLILGIIAYLLFFKP